MAQLIKLQDYISRYEQDLSRYPAQYIRLKKQRWKHIKSQWESGEPLHKPIQLWEEEVEESSTVMDKFKSLFRKTPSNQIELPVTPEENKDADDEELLDFTLSSHAKNEDELKRNFLNHLIQFQIKWASSTIGEKSFVYAKYHHDERLKHFLQRFPDTYFLLYEPVFLLKKAPVELEVVLLTPTEVWCLAFIEKNEEDAVFVGSSEHFWTVKEDLRESKILNPTISANRMGKIIKQLFLLDEVELPIRKAIVSRTGYIDFPDAPGDLLLLDKRTYGEWFQRMRKASSPLKVMQLRAAKTLLAHTETTSFRRPDWEVRTEE